MNASGLLGQALRAFMTPRRFAGSHAVSSLTQTLPANITADLRTDHAGEVGAVYIYTGALFFSRDAFVRAFATRHLETERAHLRQMEHWLPKADTSALLPFWQAAGWVTGALPALLGPQAFYATVETVERFVDQHYDEQVRRLDGIPSLKPLKDLLVACQQDEVAHRDEAAAACSAPAPTLVLRSWLFLVDAGSRAAVAISRRV
jgi:ubiquinone biosynthesis monooxygenase Coq7